LNKVALLRNQRDCGYPSLLKTAEIVLNAGAQGITVHPRPDERHVLKTDVAELSKFIQNWPDSNIELNIEGYPSEEFLDLVIKYPCHQVTLVPDAPNQKTSDHGWDFQASGDLIKVSVQKLKDAGRRVSLFIDPAAEDAEKAAQTGADRVELYTGPYAFQPELINKYVQAAEKAKEAGLGINAGHDLNLDNLGRFIEAVPSCDEVSIGHAITADALELGWNGAVAAYLTAIEYGQKRAA